MQRKSVGDKTLQVAQTEGSGAGSRRSSLGCNLGRGVGRFVKWAIGPHLMPPVQLPLRRGKGLQPASRFLVAAGSGTLQWARDNDEFLMCAIETAHETRSDAVTRLLLKVHNPPESGEDGVFLSKSRCIAVGMNEQQVEATNVRRGSRCT